MRGCVVSPAVRRLMLAVLVLFGLIWAATIAPTTVEAKSARYDRFDVDLRVLDDGTFAITETEVVSFAGGPFTKGYRTIPTARTEGTTNIRVSELLNGKQAAYTRVSPAKLTTKSHQYSVQESNGMLRIDWTFDPTNTATRTFVVQYNVLGALRVYPDEAKPNQQVWRTMVGSELTSETQVDASRVTVSLPSAVPLGDVVLESDGPDIPQQHSSDGRVFTWEKGTFGSGEEFTVRMQFPPIVQGAVAPSWQAADDAQRARQEESDSRRSIVHLMMLAAGLLLVAGGSTGAYGIWYMRGRDPHAGLIADFLPNPPEDLSPGVAGTLVDERANECDIVATLLDLARRGDVVMTDIGLLGPTKRASGHDYTLELAMVEREHAPHELRMLKAVFGAGLQPGAKTRLSQIAGSVVASYPAFREDLYQELVRRGYFTKSPENTRQSWSRGGLIVGALGIAGGVIGAIAFDAFALIPGIALAALGLVIWRLGGAMPRKTETGAEAAAKWSAFKRYLEHIERYEKLKESHEIFDRYLPYAVAFGLDDSWVAKFARVETPVPSWFETIDIPTSPRRGYTTWNTGPWPQSGGGGNGTGGGGIDLPDVDMPGMPDLQKASNRAASGVQSGSSGLMDLLKVAGAIIEIASAFSGGGSKGGSSGGGGGGFS